VRRPFLSVCHCNLDMKANYSHVTLWCLYAGAQATVCNKIMDVSDSCTFEQSLQASSALGYDKSIYCVVRNLHTFIPSKASLGRNSVLQVQKLFKRLGLMQGGHPTSNAERQSQLVVPT
jgi:hypothetical protein